MKTRTTSIVGAVVVVAVLVAVFVLMQSSGSSGGSPDIKVSDVYASETAGSSSSLYMTFRNSGGADELIGAVVSGIGQVSIHDKDMQPQTHLSVKGHDTTTLEPNGGHIMLANLSRPLTPGQQLGVRLIFKKSAAVDVTADVLSYDQINAKIAS